MRVHEPSQGPPGSRFAFFNAYQLWPVSVHVPVLGLSHCGVYSKGMKRGLFHTGYPYAVWPDIFGQVFTVFSAESDSRGPPRPPGPARHINFHETTAPQTNSKANLRRTTNTARLPSGAKSYLWRRDCQRQCAAPAQDGEDVLRCLGLQLAPGRGRRCHRWPSEGYPQLRTSRSPTTLPQNCLSLGMVSGIILNRIRPPQFVRTSPYILQTGSA